MQRYLDGAIVVMACLLCRGKGWDPMGDWRRKRGAQTKYSASRSSVLLAVPPFDLINFKATINTSRGRHILGIKYHIQIHQGAMEAFAGHQASGLGLVFVFFPFLFYSVDQDHINSPDMVTPAPTTYPVVVVKF